TSFGVSVASLSARATVGMDRRKKTVWYRPLAAMRPWMVSVITSVSWSLTPPLVSVGNTRMTRVGVIIAVRVGRRLPELDAALEEPLDFVVFWDAFAGLLDPDDDWAQVGARFRANRAAAAAQASVAAAMPRRRGRLGCRAVAISGWTI